MKGIVCNCKTGEVKEVDDGLPTPLYVEPQRLSIDLADLKNLLDYAKGKGWIK